MTTTNNSDDVGFDQIKADEQLDAMLRATASDDPVMRTEAVTQLFSLFQMPTRKAVFDGDVTGNIFSRETLPPGVSPEIPTDIITPGTENDFRAFTNPGKGYLPSVMASGDKFTLATIRDANAVEWDLEHAENARWPIIQRYMEAFSAGFVKKQNDNCFHTLLAAMADRGITIYDAAAPSKVFTKKLFSLLRCAFARNSGGNSTSISRGKWTDAYISCEGIESILNWNLNDIPDSVRASMYSMSGGDNTTINILGVTIHEMLELGAGQEYQDYYINNIGANLTPVLAGPPAHAAADTELGIALDLKNRDSFFMLEVKPLTVFQAGGEGSELHRAQKGGAYGWRRYGVGVLDTRRIMPISY